MPRPAGDQPARPEAVGQPPGDRRDADDHQGRGQEPYPGLQRRVAEDVLHVEGEEEEDSEHREGDDQGDDDGAEEVAIGEEAELDHRHLDPAARPRRRRPGRATAPIEQARRSRVEPQPQLLPSTRARISAVRPPVSVDDTGVVDLAPDRGVARLAHREQRRRHGPDRDRDVEVEDRPPADVLGEEAAERPGRRPAPAPRPPPTFPSPCRARRRGRRR